MEDADSNFLPYTEEIYDLETEELERLMIKIVTALEDKETVPPGFEDYYDFEEAAEGLKEAVELEIDERKQVDEVINFFDMKLPDYMDIDKSPADLEDPSSEEISTKAPISGSSGSVRQSTESENFYDNVGTVSIGKRESVNFNKNPFGTPKSTQDDSQSQISETSYRTTDTSAQNRKKVFGIGRKKNNKK